ncbi:hypothetical protein Tco_0579584, partial [Tanacetum coccineum]
LESVEARLDVYKKNEIVFKEDIKILKLDIKLKDNALTKLRKKFEKAEKIQVSDKFKTGVGFDSQVFDSQENDRYKTSEGYHVVPPPYTGNFMPPKSDLVLADEEEYVFSESITSEVKTSVSTKDVNQEDFLRVFESDVKGSTTSSSSTQNVAFVSSESTSSTNDVSTAYGVSTSSGHNSQRKGSSSYTDEVDEFDLKEMDLKWHFARECRSKGNQESGRIDAGNTRYKAKDNGRRLGKQEEPKALVTIDGMVLIGLDKSGLGYGDQIHEGVLSYENEVLESVFDSRSSDVEDSPVYDRFAKVKGMHAVPPLMTGIYMPPKSDFGIDESNFTYGPKQSKTSESAANTSDSVSCESNSSVETLESVPKPAIIEPKAVSKPKVWSDAPIIELVNERYSASSPEGYDLMLWGDLHTLFKPDEEDKIWKNQYEYNVISWSLYDFCGIHILLMQNGIAIHMLTEKKYPLSQEMISKMLKKKLEVDHESSQAFELLRFIRSQVQK